MRSLRVLCLVAFAAAPGQGAAAQDVARASVTVNAQFSARTSLKVSSDLLQFDIIQPGETATAAVDFSAGARTASTSDIVLSIEPARAIDGPGGAADVETMLSVAGEGQGVMAGTLDAARGTVVGRWQGSGRRDGRLVFTLRANAAGHYSMPIRFVLSTP